MHDYISDLHWVMLQYTYLLNTIFVPYMESHNWVNAKNLTSGMFPNDRFLFGNYLATQARDPYLVTYFFMKIRDEISQNSLD